MSKISEVKGTITLADGTTSEFSIGTDAGWQQWGATTERLGQTVDAIEVMARALAEDNHLVSDADPEPCRTCGQANDDNEGWDGECGTCADRRESAMTIDLYHRTSEQAAQMITSTGTWLSRENTGKVYFSTLPNGQGEGYGDTVVHVRVPIDVAELDDEFPDGEQHYRIAATSLLPEWLVRD